MLSYADCVGLSELTPEEIAALARRLHVPEIVAVEMGACLCQTAKGKQLIRRLSGQAVEEPGCLEYPVQVLEHAGRDRRDRLEDGRQAVRPPPSGRA
jgi:hypothetical protein